MHTNGNIVTTPLVLLLYGRMPLKVIQKATLPEVKHLNKLQICSGLNLKVLDLTFKAESNLNIDNKYGNQNK